MAESATRPERRELAPGLEISRMVTGLWQVADMERDGTALDVATAATALADYAAAGFEPDQHRMARPSMWKVPNFMPVDAPRSGDP